MSLQSFQSVTSNVIECCICLDEIKNENTFMPDCKHSWCLECDKNMEKNNIEKCPICRNIFKRILRHGKWKFVNNIYGGEWIYQAGTKDSKRKRAIRKMQCFFSNLFLSPSTPGNIGV